MGERLSYRPFEYPNVLEFREAIKEARWDIAEFNLKKDAFEYRNILTNEQREAIKRTVLTISQVEASGVKNFWIQFTNWFTKSEFVSVGVTIGENEVVHAEAYSQILTELGLEEEFAKTLAESEVFLNRVNYLKKYLKKQHKDFREYMFQLVLFSIIMEDVTLFGYFAIIKSFRKKHNQLTEIDSIIDATMKEEAVHGDFGKTMINMVRKEKPEWFDDDFYKNVYSIVTKAYEAEKKIVDWIFEKGEIDSISTLEILNYIKRRFNKSLQDIGGEAIFKVNEEIVKSLDWVDEEADAYIRNDFFSTQSTNYTKYNRDYSADSLFD